jgi:hypothetical protein
MLSVKKPQGLSTHPARLQIGRMQPDEDQPQ